MHIIYIIYACNICIIHMYKSSNKKFVLSYRLILLLDLSVYIEVCTTYICM